MESKVTPWQWAACIGIVLCQILDTATTIIGLNLGGTEQNPVINFVLQWGLFPFIAFKLVLAVLLGYLALVTKYVVWILIALYAVVIVNNINIIGQLS